MISTHILDTSKGHPASGVAVRLYKMSGTEFRAVGAGETNADGRLAFDHEKSPGVYQLLFEVAEYLRKDGQAAFFVSAPVIFEIKDTTRKYHVPLLLSPFGYSTYRGS